MVPSVPSVDAEVQSHKGPGSPTRLLTRVAAPTTSSMATARLVSTGATHFLVPRLVPQPEYACTPESQHAEPAFSYRHHVITKM